MRKFRIFNNGIHCGHVHANDYYPALRLALDLARDNGIPEDGIDVQLIGPPIGLVMWPEAWAPRTPDVPNFWPRA